MKRAIERPLYHARDGMGQRGSLKDCMNNLMQGPYFAWDDILEVATDIDAEGVGSMSTAIHSGLGGVLSDYNVEVVEVLLEEFESDLFHAESEEGEELMAQCEEQVGFLVERNFCWSCIRFTEGFFWDLNPANSEPKILEEDSLFDFLDELMQDSAQVYIIVGDLPDASDFPSIDDVDSQFYHNPEVMASDEFAEIFDAFTSQDPSKRLPEEVGLVPLASRLEVVKRDRSKVFCAWKWSKIIHIGPVHNRQKRAVEKDSDDEDEDGGGEDSDDDDDSDLVTLLVKVEGIGLFKFEVDQGEALDQTANRAKLLYLTSWNFDIPPFHLCYMVKRTVTNKAKKKRMKTLPEELGLSIEAEGIRVVPIDMEALRQGEELDKSKTACLLKWKRVDTLSGMSKEATGEDMDQLKIAIAKAGEYEFECQNYQTFRSDVEHCLYALEQKGKLEETSQTAMDLIAGGWISVQCAM
jgi:hypothetical protein